MHPWAWWCWAIGIGIAVSCTTNPLLLVLIATGMAAVVLLRRGNAPWAKSVKAYLMLSLFVIGMRVFFQVVIGSGAGETVLFSLPEVPLPDWAAGIRLGGAGDRGRAGPHPVRRPPAGRDAAVHRGGERPRQSAPGPALGAGGPVRGLGGRRRRAVGRAPADRERPAGPPGAPAAGRDRHRSRRAHHGGHAGARRRHRAVDLPGRRHGVAGLRPHPGVADPRCPAGDAGIGAGSPLRRLPAAVHVVVAAGLRHPRARPRRNRLGPPARRPRAPGHRPPSRSVGLAGDARGGGRRRCGRPRTRRSAGSIRPAARCDPRPTRWSGPNSPRRCWSSSAWCWHLFRSPGRVPREPSSRCATTPGSGRCGHRPSRSWSRGDHLRPGVRALPRGHPADAATRCASSCPRATCAWWSARPGAGKSTLLGAINGLVPHFTGGTLGGRVVVDGWDTALHRPRDLAEVVGYVGQDPQRGFVTDTVEDEIAYGMEQLGIDPAGHAQAGGGDPRPDGHRRPAPASAGRTLRRPAAAGGDRGGPRRAAPRPRARRTDLCARPDRCPGRAVGHLHPRARGGPHRRPGRAPPGTRDAGRGLHDLAPRRRHGRPRQPARRPRPPPASLPRWPPLPAQPAGPRYRSASARPAAASSPKACCPPRRCPRRPRSVAGAC